MTDGYTYDDGGRAAAGFKGHTGDCVARAISIASGRPYADVYAALASGNASQRITKGSAHHNATRGKLTAAHGIWTKRKWFKDYMTSLGFVWVPTMTIGSGTTVHLEPKELPPTGRYVVKVTHHLTALIDGVIHDTYDPRREGQWHNVAGPHHPNGDRDPLPGETKNVNGVWHKSGGRAVFGYWEYQQ